MSENIDWLVRYGHVLTGAIWVGGYAVLALVIVPLLAREASEQLTNIAIKVVRVVSFIGIGTALFGLFLISRTRGFGELLEGEWGGLIILSAILAVALAAIGDGGMAPALRRIPDGGDVAAARRWAWIGFVVSIVIIGLMTRAVYASS